MIGKPRDVVGAFLRLELVQEQERVVVVESGGSEAPADPYAGPLGRFLSSYDLDGVAISHNDATLALVRRLS
jgi:hypothetical protein